MPKIRVARAHTLKPEEVAARVDQYLARLRDDKLKMMNFQFTWNKDRSGVDITGNGFKGGAKISPREVEVALDLSLLLSPFKGQVEDSLKRGLEKYLA